MEIIYYRKNDREATGEGKVQYEYNGYTKGKVYWFKYEPIKWNYGISESQKILVSYYVLDGTYYRSDSASSADGIYNFVESFGKTAFSKGENAILSTLQSQSGVYDLSLGIVPESDKTKEATDYAKIRGCYVPDGIHGYRWVKHEETDIYAKNMITHKGILDHLPKTNTYCGIAPVFYFIKDA